MNRPAIEPDTKDWTWVLHEPCPECGFVAAALDRDTLGDVVRADATGWAAVLALPGVRERPDATTWSPTEYACHVRDVHRVFAERLRLMLEEDEPTFADWDQDETALAERYDEQDPADVAPELLQAAEAVAQRYDALRGAGQATWARRGVRSNGSEFTVDSIARYHLHDVLHHSHDVRGFAARATAAAYDEDAAAFADATAHLPEHHVAELDWFVGAAGAGGRVLEIGSGGGRDADELERRGLSVRRTDVSPGFVARLREQGHQAEVLDPLTDGLGGPYDGVWASACLLHVDRADLPEVLRRLAAATRPGGALGASLKEGDGTAWSTHGSVRGARRFTFWREEPLRAALAEAGWDLASLTRREGLRFQSWLTIRASRRTA